MAIEMKHFLLPNGELRGYNIYVDKPEFTEEELELLSEDPAKFVEETEYTKETVYCMVQDQSHFVQEDWTELSDEQLASELESRIEPPTVEQQIADLERQITQRHLRSALLGDEFAINHIQAIEGDVAALRALL